jgi:hypothetical protein
VGCGGLRKRRKRKMVENEKTFLQEALDILRDVVTYSSAFMGGVGLFDRIDDLDRRITAEEARQHKVLSEELEKVRALGKRLIESDKHLGELVKRTKGEVDDRGTE